MYSYKMSSVAFKPYETYKGHAVCGMDVINCVTIHDDGSETPVPVFIHPTYHPSEVFAVWHRVITHHLSQGNWNFIHENALFNPFERSLGQFQVEMQSIKTDASRQKIALYREEFDHIVSWFNQLRYTA